MKKKKDIAVIGAVLHKINDLSALQPWAEYVEKKDTGVSGSNATAESLLRLWGVPESGWQFFSAADPKGAKKGGFDYQQGLIVLSLGRTRSIIEGLFKTTLPAELDCGEAGYIQSLVTKVRHKIVGKYLLNAAERVISEKYSQVFVCVNETNLASQRFYKAAGYEEVARIADCIKSGNTELLFMKRLSLLTLS